MPNCNTIKISHSIKVHAFQKEKANIYILAPSLPLNHSTSCKTEDELQKTYSHHNVDLDHNWKPRWGGGMWETTDLTRSHLCEGSSQRLPLEPLAGDEPLVNPEAAAASADAGRKEIWFFKGLSEMKLCRRYRINHKRNW